MTFGTDNYMVLRGLEPHLTITLVIFHLAYLIMRLTFVVLSEISQHCHKL